MDSNRNYHKGKYYITFKRGYEETKKDITITIDKIFEKDCLKILLSDDEDPTFLCVINVSRVDYEDLKKQQGLLVDFDNFPAQLIRLLHQCASNNMFLMIHLTNPALFHFEVVEHNEFKRLIHLSLKTGPACDSEIKKYMAETIVFLKKSLEAVKNSLSNSEALWNDKCIFMERKIQDLTLAINQLEDEKKRKEIEYQEILRHEKEKIAQEQQHWQKNNEINTKSQITSMQETLSRKDRHIDELNNIVRQVKDNCSQLENQLSDKSQRVCLLESELQKSHIEAATLKAKNCNLEKEHMEKDKHIHHLNLRCTELDKYSNDNSSHIRDLNNTIQKLKNEKAVLEERLALSESLVTRKNDAAQTTSEQLMKANEIISKQNVDLIEMKEKLLCRTAIALEQEKVIEKNTKEIEDLKTKISETKQNMDSIKSELNSLKEKYQSNEQALKDKDETIKNNNMVIQWLHKKVEDKYGIPDSPAARECQNPATSNRDKYFISKNSPTNETTDESIDFYADSKLSNIDSSPMTGLQTKSRTGLDPKYLQPATDNRGTKSKADKVPATSTITQKGKENKKIELPKVDYREKKSSKSATYRSTPVSAYFP